MNWNMIGHEGPVSQLKQHMLHNQVQHAYLFTGPAGVGRRTLALQFARALNCLNPPAIGEACGECRVCVQIERMQHADLAVVQALNDEGSARVGGTIKIEQIRDVQHILSLTPNEAKYRISLFLRFNEANVNAQNALLKTLEEAPKHVKLLMTADESSNLLETITSRCEVIRLQPLPITRLSSVLQEKFSISENEALRYANLSKGCPGLAFSFHENPEQVELWQEKINDLLQLLRASRRIRFSYAEDMTGKRSTKIERQVLRDHVRDTYDIWLSFWRDVMLCAAGCSHLITNRDWKDEINQVAQKTGMEMARRQTEALQLGISHIRENLDVRLLTEILLLDMPYLN